MAADADLAVAGLHDIIKRIRDDESVLVPNKTLRGLVAALDIVLGAYAAAQTRETPALRLLGSRKARGPK